MKKIEAIIKPFKLDEVRDALGEAGVDGMTVTEVIGTGRREKAEVYRGSDHSSGFLPKLKLDLVVADELADRAVEAIVRSSRTGKLGDGKVFVSTLVTAVRIRTEEAGNAAI